MSPLLKPLAKGCFEKGYVLLAGSQGPYMSKTLRGQPVETEKCCHEIVGKPHLQYQSNAKQANFSIAALIGRLAKYRGQTTYQVRKLL